MKRYVYRPESLKREVVREVLSGHLSISEARRKYNIPGSSTINYWIAKFDSSRSKSPFMDYSKLSKEELIKQLKSLNTQLEDEQIRSEGYSKMIDIAEEELQISIRKKSGAKQSKQ